MERIQGRIVRAFPDRGFCIIEGADGEDAFAHRTKFKDQSSVRQLLSSEMQWRRAVVVFSAGEKQAGKSRPALEIEVMA